MRKTVGLAVGLATAVALAVVPQQTTVPLAYTATYADGSAEVVCLMAQDMTRDGLAGILGESAGQLVDLHRVPQQDPTCTEVGN